MNKPNFFEPATPESQGLRSAALLGFLDAAAREQLELHALLVLRQNRLVFEGYWAPYGPEKTQRICSAGKALVATAVLFAIQEGHFSPNDRLLELIPEAAPAGPAPGAQALTVYDLLTMHAGHREDSFRLTAEAPEGAAKAFLSLPLIDPPGTQFFYDNGIPDVLAELVRRFTGCGIMDYLRPRLFAPLGMDSVRVAWEGSREALATFCMSARDFLKFTVFFAQAGAWQGKQLLRADLAAAARDWQVPVTDAATAADVPEQLPQPGDGYGFQIWRNRFGGFTLNGGCGQLGICFPAQALCIAVQANEPRSERIEQLLWQHLRGGLFARPLPEAPAEAQALADRAAALSRCPANAAAPGIRFGGLWRLAQPLYDTAQIGLQFTRDGFSAAFDGQTPIAAALGQWTPCHIPMAFTETRGGYRNAEHGLRLDTNVGSSFTEGCCAGFWETPSRFVLLFRSDGWLGGHALSFSFQDGGACVIRQECGISRNLRLCPAKLLDGRWQDHMFSDYVLADKLDTQA